MIKEWNNWHKLVDEFLKALNGTNKHYWGAAATPSSELARRVDEVYDELAEQKRNKKEDEKNKREDEKNKREEEKRNKEIKLEMNQWNANDCKKHLDDNIVKVSVGFINKMRGAFYSHYDQVKGSLSSHSRFSVVSNKADWNQNVDKYFNELIHKVRELNSSVTSIKDAIHNKDMETIIRSIKRTYHGISTLLDKNASTPEGKLFLELNEDTNFGPVKGLDDENGMKKLSALLKQVFDNNLKEFNDATLK